jgi:hypothetical protein
MEFQITTNWEEPLLEGLKNSKVTAAFGRSSQDIVGGHIPSFSLPQLGKKYMEAHIAKAHAQGLKFYYLLSAPCFANAPYNRQGYQALEAFFQELGAWGIDGVVVNSPYLVTWLGARYPQWKIVVSWLAGINSVAAAKKWLELGAQALMLDPHSNRDFSTLQALRENISAELWLLANHALLWEGPFELEEAVGGAYSSQEKEENGYYLPAPSFSHWQRLLNKPAELVRARWIRPEDLAVYEAMGFDKFVLLDVHHNTNSLLKYLGAYQERKSPANLLDILALSKTSALLPSQIRYFLQPEEVNIQKVSKISELLTMPWEEMVKVDSQKLDTFLRFFQQNDCRRTACDTCRHCDRAFEAAGQVNSPLMQKHQEKLYAFQSSLMQGEIFREAKTEAHGLKWTGETENILATMMNIVPSLLREVCLKATRSRAEANALERSSLVVESQDVARAFLVETPDSFKRVSLAKLKKMGLERYL